ncbi:endonuclease/exonuclease/phosphatase family protein [Aeromicrobium sp. NPDC092404]|uniref:endonuclease/exonuclease/phosphatase family protein n=1 Tax=Aeromicrobium sp. NPDC092404 TaxID=3154976 RepID=UPI00342F07F4
MLVVGGLATGLAVTYATPDSLDAPTKLSATPLSPTSVKLDWAGSEGVDSYVVKVGSDRALTQAKTTKVPAKGTSVTLADIGPTTPGVDRFYRIDAIRDGKVRSSRTARFTLKPGSLGGLRIKQTTADGVRATWKKVANARQFDVTIARDKAFTKQVSAVRTLAGSHSFVTRGLTAATVYWIRVRPVNGDQAGRFSKPVKFRTMVRKTSFKVGTWNVCSEKCSGYAGRAQIGAAFLNANKLDMFGLQEAGGQRVGRTTNAIWSGGSQKFVRASGGGEAGYIFYRPKLFTQLSGGLFSIGDGRHTVWAKFKVRQTGRIFYFVDIHLDNGKGNDSARSREMNVTLSRMAQINDTGLPMVYVGDFNSGKHRGADSPGVQMRGAGMTDSIDLVKEPVNAQYNSSYPDGGTLRSGAHVDHIFVSKQFTVLAWKQLVRLSASGAYARPAVSDHNAISAVVALDAEPKKLGEPTATTTVSGLDAPKP